MALTLPVIGVKSMALLGRPARGESLPEALEPTEEYKLFIDPDVGCPPAPGFYVAHPNDAGNIPFAYRHVSRILHRRNVSKVFNSIVQLVAVYVVDLAFGPPAIVDEPRDAMCHSAPPPNRCSEVSTPIDGSECLSSSVSSVKHSRFHLWRSDALGEVFGGHVPPFKFPRSWVIVNKAFGSFASQIHFSCTLLAAADTQVYHIRTAG